MRTIWKNVWIIEAMVHINNLKKDVPKSKLILPKDNEFTDNKLYNYLQPADSPLPGFYGQPKIQKNRNSIIYHSLHWGFNPPQKHHPFFPSHPSPHPPPPYPLKLHTVQGPLFR